MVLFKELSLAVFLVALLAPAFQVWGQPACTSHFMPNSTVDIKQYNHIGLHVLKTITTSGDSGMTDCSLRCCETGNCSLVIYTNDENRCLLIHCVTEEACSPIPSNTSQWIQSIRNNATSPTDILASNNTDANTTVSSPINNTGINASTTFPENTSVSMNDTNVSSTSDSNITSENSTNLSSNDTAIPTDMISDNITMENTTGLNASEVDSSNVTSSEESFGTTDNSTGEIPSNDTGKLREPVTESIFIPPNTSDANSTFSMENGTKSLSMNSTLTTPLPAVLIDSNSTWDNSTNGTHASFNPNGRLSSVNNTAKEEADSSEEGAAIIGDHSMMVILVATLSIGMLLFIAIVAVVSKKAVDGWQRRHYSRIDYLVNGMYN